MLELNIYGINALVWRLSEQRSNRNQSKKVFEPLLKEECRRCPFGSSPLICCMTENPSQTYLDVYSNINIISGLAYCTCTFLTHHHNFQEKSSIFMDVYMTLFEIHSSFHASYTYENNTPCRTLKTTLPVV